MLYVTGIHALNLPCKLMTCGDWHCSALKWEALTIRNSEDMFFKSYGIEPPKAIPNHDEKYYVANHIRALLDLVQEQDFNIAQGMNKEFICNPSYDEEVFSHIIQLKNTCEWERINQFMLKEYLSKWFNYVRRYTNGN